MSQSSAAICLALGLLLLAGCGSTESPAPRPQTEAAGPVQPRAEEQIQGSTVPEATGIPPEAMSPPAAEMPAVADGAPAEPNTAPRPERALVSESPRTVPREQAAETESNEGAGSEPALPEPEAPVTAHPLAPAEPLEEDEPDALASFYEEYAEFLNDHVLEDGRVDYQALRRKRLRLKDLLSRPDELDPNLYQEWSEGEKLAFWINTYNLKMLEIIARNYPIQSSWWLRLTWPPSDIRHIGGIWSNYRFIVMDEEFTLGEVERRFFRKTFGDPRAFLAITYAARSGPTLRRTPYQGEGLEQQLDGQVREFLAGDKGFRIDREKAVVYLSALFKPSWHGRDFVSRYGTDKKFKNHPAETRAVLNFLTQYLPRDDVYYLEVENYTLTYMNFDWRLNDSARGY